MDRFRKTFSIRNKKKPENTEAIKPQQWIDDEKKINEGSCSFHVKYLGNIEVFESRGMQVCEEALKALRKSKKVQRAILFISGDALRVSDEISKHLIVDQTIEKVSFCAPDRGHEKGFAYICRDGATRRWMCHAFLAVKESGERLSHAVGCAFAICLEKKQKRERDAVQKAGPTDEGFVRMSSFRQTSLAERLIDPQSAIVVEPLMANTKSLPIDDDTASEAIVPYVDGAYSPTTNLNKQGAIPRPHATPSLIERQTSLRLFPKLQDNSPFKKSLSLRLQQPSSSITCVNRIKYDETIPEEQFSIADSFPHSNADSLLPICITLPSPPAFVPSTLPVSSPDISFPLFKNAILDTEPADSVSYSNRIFENGDFFTGQNMVDPFSAAPFNPQTILQHHQTQMQPPPLTSGTDDFKSPPLRWSAFGLDSAGLSTPEFIPTSNLSRPVPELLSSASADSASVNFGVKPGHFQQAGGDLENSNNWLSPRPPLLPPEQPDRCPDPFDVGWAERATAFVNYQLSNCSIPPNPQLSPEYGQNHVAVASTNPFISLNAVSTQTWNSDYY